MKFSAEDLTLLKTFASKALVCLCNPEGLNNVPRCGFERGAIATCSPQWKAHRTLREIRKRGLPLPERWESALFGDDHVNHRRSSYFRSEWDEVWKQHLQELEP
jgi:hypothetical protein